MFFRRSQLIISTTRIPQKTVLHTYKQALFNQTFCKMSSNSSSNPPSSSFKNLTNDHWRTVLSPEQFKVLREAHTEPSNSGKYNKHYEKGVYRCAACSEPLFISSFKFDSGCGWPAFFDSIEGKVIQKPDNSGGMKRVEILCASCNSHLGHIFSGEGFRTPTDERYCVNSICLSFDPVVDPKNH